MKDTELKELMAKHTDKDGIVNWVEVNKVINEHVDSVSLKNSKKSTDKTRSELLSDLGIDNVESFKEQQQKLREESDKTKSETQKQFEKQNKQIEELNKINAENTANNTLLKQTGQARDLGVKKDLVGDFLTLAKTKVTEEMDIGVAMKQTLEQYSNFKEATDNEPPPNQFGGFNFGVANKGAPGNVDPAKAVAEALGVKQEK